MPALRLRPLSGRVLLPLLAVLLLLPAAVHAEDSRVERARKIREDILAKRARSLTVDQKKKAPPEPVDPFQAAVDAARARLAEVEARVEAGRRRSAELAAPRDKLLAKSEELGAAVAKLEAENRTRVEAVYRSARIGTGAAGWQADDRRSRRLSRYLAAVAKAQHDTLARVELEHGAVLASLDRARGEDAAAARELALLESEKLEAQAALERATVEAAGPATAPVHEDEELPVTASNDPAAQGEGEDEVAAGTRGGETPEQELARLMAEATAKLGHAPGTPPPPENEDFRWTPGTPGSANASSPAAASAAAAPATAGGDVAAERLAAAKKALAERNAQRIGETGAATPPGAAAEAVAPAASSEAEERAAEEALMAAEKAAAEKAVAEKLAAEKAANEKAALAKAAAEKLAAEKAALKAEEEKLAAAKLAAEKAEEEKRAAEAAAEKKAAELARKPDDEGVDREMEPGPAVLAPSSAPPVGETAALPQGESGQGSEAPGAEASKKKGLISRLFAGDGDADKFAAARGTLRAPVAGKVVANYGQQHKSGATYRGVILRAQHDAPIKAVAEGRVSFVGNVPGIGNTVIVSHGDRYHTVYARLGNVKVKEGDRVTSGGEVGELPSDNADMHFELREGGKPIDPVPWLKGGIPGAAP